MSERLLALARAGDEDAARRLYREGRRQNDPELMLQACLLRAPGPENWRRVCELVDTGAGELAAVRDVLAAWPERLRALTWKDGSDARLWEALEAGTPPPRSAFLVVFFKGSVTERRLRLALKHGVLERLQVLDINTVYFDERERNRAEDALFEWLPRLAELRDLTVWVSEERCTDLMRALPRDLERLDLRTCDVGPEGIDVLLQRPVLQLSLKSLCLSATAVDIPSLQRLFSPGRLSALRELELSHLNLSHIPETLREASFSLHSLNLERVPLSAADVETLVSLPALAHIGHLNLKHTNISESDLEVLASAPWTRLETLDVSQNPLTRRGLELILDAAQRLGMRTLIARECGLGRSVMSQLRESLEGPSRVRHKRFGEGELVERRGNVLEIAFDTAGTKRLAERFVEILPPADRLRIVDSFTS